MPSLSPEQHKVLSKIKSIGRQRGASEKEVKAAVETGLVESGLRNLPGGDADSQGWRQERASLYKNPRNLSASINRFYDEASAVKGKYGSAGQLAAAVQRPAAQYRGRYQQRSSDAERLLGQIGSGGAQAGAAGSRTTRTVTTTPGVDNSAQRSQLRAAYLLNRGNPDALLQLKAGLDSAQDVAPTTTSSTSTMPGASSSSAGTSKYTARADAINAKALPYKWGGGHGGKVNAYKATPLDCSGAVSSVLGINPRVSGDFENWGKAGAAPGGKGVTVYSNKEHVLMEIDGHFFGTSHSNPGGGAGWIKRSEIPKGYLSKFTARHLT